MNKKIKFKDVVLTKRSYNIMVERFNDIQTILDHTSISMYTSESNPLYEYIIDQLDAIYTTLTVGANFKVFINESRIAFELMYDTKNNNKVLTKEDKLQILKLYDTVKYYLFD